MRRALITGITGQDGSYLAEFLLTKGYEVHGLVRRSSSFTTGRIDHIFDRLHLHYGDITDGSSVERVVRESQPHEVYNLAAQSHVRVSFDMPSYTHQTVALGATHLLNACGPDVRFYQASSSEQFGASPPPQNERTPFAPRSPYGVAKVAAHWAAVNARQQGRHVSCGILFNHESPRRGETFVTRKITRAVGRIRAGTQKTLALGNLDAKRDWGYAGDYVEAMWLMLQQDEPDDYVIATGESYSVEEFCAAAFGGDHRPYVTQNARYWRPTEVDHLLGDASKARDVLGWRPTVRFDALVAMMLAHDCELALDERCVAERRLACSETRKRRLAAYL